MKCTYASSLKKNKSTFCHWCCSLYSYSIDPTVDSIFRALPLWYFHKLRPDHSPNSLIKLTGTDISKDQPKLLFHNFMLYIAEYITSIES